MSSPYPILDNRPIDQWKVVELKEELKRRKLTTKGLKDDLVKRLNEAICAELSDKGDAVNEDFPNDPQPEPQSEKENEEESNATGTASDAIIDDCQPKILFEEEKADNDCTKVSTDVPKDDGRRSSVDPDVPEEVDGSRGIVDEKKVAVSEVANAADAGPTEEMQVGQVPMVEPAVVVSEDVAPVISSNGKDLQHTGTHNESGDLKSPLEKDDSSKGQLRDDSSKSPHADGELKSLHVDASINLSGPDNQVSEVCPDLGFQVLSDSISTESVSINETNELKDNIIANDVKLELDVKPEMVQLSSSSVVPDGEDSHPMDVSEPQEKKSIDDETSRDHTDNMDIVKRNDIEDMGSPEKLNLDRSSGEDSMDEDVLESKQIDVKTNSEQMEVKAEKTEASRMKDEEGFVDVVGDDISEDIQVANIEIEKDPAAISTKRKLQDQSGVGNNDVAKRQRRWNSESLKLPGTQSVNIVTSTTPKDTVRPFKRNFSKSNSTVSEEAPKERVVPPSPNPPTNSLRIDRFLRPFTLKAVQELLGKTGNVTSFWMDHIKTHCYVSYSSVEEALETRNALYNLQWPSNGGRQLIAEFVDPQEVKARADPPLKSPATPVSMAPPSFAHVQPTRQPQPSPRHQSQRQQLPPPPSLLPPPPPLISPPTARDYPPQAREQLPPAREQPLPPPPPITEKVDPPIVTLDDLFRKTKATPRIYYLQLSDEQVAAKLKAQGKNINQ